MDLIVIGLMFLEHGSAKLLGFRRDIKECLVYGIEIDPAYCDVTIRRLRSVCGLEAVLEATGQRFGEVEAERAAAAENLGEAAPSQEGVA
jgi:hypothetical protein